MSIKNNRAFMRYRVCAICIQTEIVAYSYVGSESCIVWAKETSILKAVQDQQQTICYHVCAYTEFLKESMIVKDSDTNILQKWSTKNLDCLHSVKSSSSKPSSIPKWIDIPGAVINQTGFLSMGPNIVNVSKSSRKSTMVVNSAIRNEGMGELNGDTKVCLKI